MVLLALAGLCPAVIYAACEECAAFLYIADEPRPPQHPVRWSPSRK